MDKRFMGILAAIVVIFVGIFAVSQRSANNSSGSGNNSSNQPTNHVLGKGKSGITLLEYGDFECPICEAYYLPLKQVQTQYNDEIFFQFRNLPLTAIHQNAFAGARAAEAASFQGKYWQMHDKLYDNQNEWSTNPNPQTFFNNYATQLGLNLSQFKQDYASSKVNDAINADLNAFDKTGKDKATPTIFLDGTFIPLSEFVDQQGQPQADKIAAVVQAEIDKKAGK